MNREQLIQALAVRIDVAPHSAQVFLHACFDIIKSQLRSGDDISLPLLGRWTPLHGEDGALTGVSYTALVQNRSDTAGEVLHGPASSIDARHFIPAAALEHGNGVRRSPVDIASLVAEVRREYAPDPIPDPVGTAVSDAVPASVRGDASPLAEDPLPHAPAIESEEDILLEAEMEAENYPGHTAAQEEADPAGGELVETGIDEEYADLAEVDSDPYPGIDDMQDPMTDSDVDAIIDTTIDASPEAEDPGDEEGVDDGHDPLADDEVFNRNRDQLYHPPEETSKRPLLITAAILTLCVLVIIVYILLDHTAPRELPGREPVGMRAIAGEFHTHS